MAIATSRAGRNLMAGSDDERSQGGRHVPNDAPTVPSSVLDQDIAGRQHHLRAIVELECHVAGEKDPEIRRVGPVKAVLAPPGSSPSSRCISGVGSGAITPGKYVHMM